MGFENGNKQFNLWNAKFLINKVYNILDSPNFILHGDKAYTEDKVLIYNIFIYNVPHKVIIYLFNSSLLSDKFNRYYDTFCNDNYSGL